MNQRTHAWLAARAVALLEDSGKANDLVGLLAPYVDHAVIGAWLPDLQDAKAGFGRTDNHVLKMEPYDGEVKERFVVTRDKLTKSLGPTRLMSKYAVESTVLDDTWWNTPFKADPPPGQHLANRAMAFATMIKDLLLLGDKQLATLVPGKVSFVEDMDPKALTRKQQVAAYFFMLSHFVADACMPCHSDARALSSYSKGKIHKELESRWSKQIGTYFEHDNILKKDPTSKQILQKARDIGDTLGLSLSTEIPAVQTRDTWAEVMLMCRASFAVACIAAPYRDYPATGTAAPSLADLYGGVDGEVRLEELDRIIMHDSVHNIAIIWKHIWDGLETKN
jgi:hypothetical protein